MAVFPNGLTFHHREERYSDRRNTGILRFAQNELVVIAGGEDEFCALAAEARGKSKPKSARASGDEDDSV